MFFGVDFFSPLSLGRTFFGGHIRSYGAIPLSQYKVDLKNIMSFKADSGQLTYFLLFFFFFFTALWSQTAKA